MSQAQYTLPTHAGNALIANAVFLDAPVEITEVALGDGDITALDDPAAMEALLNERWRGPVQSIQPDPNTPSQIMIDVLIPSDAGGFTIREAGVFDKNGVLIAVARVADTYKPVTAEGMASEISYRFIFAVGNADAVQLLLDPTITIASREHVDTSLADHDADETAHPSLRIGQAAETIRGTITIARPEDVALGVDHTSAVTPATLSAELAKIDTVDRNALVLTNLLDAMHEGAADQRLNASTDPLADLSRMDPARSHGVLHDPARARIGNGGEAMVFTTLPLAIETPPAQGWLLVLAAAPDTVDHTDLVPTMTANNAPEGQVLFTGTSWNTATYKPWHAFDQVEGTRHIAHYGGPNEWIGYDFGDGNPQTVRRFTLHQTNATGNGVGGSPASVHLEYSDDLASWSLAGTYETPTAVTEPQAFDTPDMGAHRAWRVRGAQGAGDNWVVETVQFHGLLHTPGDPLDYASGVVTGALSDDDGATWTDVPLEREGWTEDGWDILYAEIDLPEGGTMTRARIGVAAGTAVEIGGYVVDWE